MRSDGGSRPASARGPGDERRAATMRTTSGATLRSAPRHGIGILDHSPCPRTATEAPADACTDVGQGVAAETG
jgi:hypothetical protein